MKNSTVLYTLSLSFICVFLACGQKVAYDLPGFSNQGVIPLSIQDAYNGANLFIAKEMENSPFLYRFIESHGAPDAIEVVDRKFEDSKVHLFYTQERAVYSMVADSKEKTRQWVVRGPFQMNWKDLRELSRLNRNKYSRPALVLWGTEKKFKEPPRQPVAQIITPVIPTPLPTPKYKPANKSGVNQKAPTATAVATLSRDEELLTLDPDKFKPLNSDQLAILMSKGYAKRADNGDAIHIIKSANEDIKSISKWYTNDEANHETILAVNHLTKDSALTIGAEVRIPIAVLKQIKSMPIGFGK